MKLPTQIVGRLLAARTLDPLDLPLQRRAADSAGNVASSYNNHDAEASTSASGSSGSDSGGGMQGGVVVAVVVGAVLVGSLTAYLLLRHLRGRYSNPRYVPTAYLKERWRRWKPSNVRKRYSSSLLSPDQVSEQNASTSRLPNASSALRLLQTITPGSRSNVNLLNNDNNNSGSSNSNANANANVNRHASVRSVMTLPAYSSDALPTEKILGREGERGGIDVVLEFPETGEEEEVRRDEEMEALYRIRVARREERTARDERRRLRAEARARGDAAALEEMRRQRREERERARQDNTEALVQEHQQLKDRARRMAAIEYADIGVARPDGSRVRANSSNSDNVPLLESAGSMGDSGSRPRANRSRTDSSGIAPHFRNQSSTSLVHVMTPDMSDDDGGRSSAEGGTPWESLTSLHRRNDSENPPLPSMSAEQRAEQHRSLPPDYEGAWLAETLHRPSTSATDASFPLEERDLGDAPPYQSAPVTPIEPLRLTTQFTRELPSIEVTPFSPDLSRNPSTRSRAA